MDESRNDRLIALLLTLLVVGATVGALFWLSLVYAGERPRKWPPEDTSELLMEGEYVKYGDTPEYTQEQELQVAESSTDAMPDGNDLTDSGEPADQTPPTVTSTDESPMKVQEKPQPEKTGPTKEELAEQEKIKQQQEAASKINNRVNFGGSSSGTNTSGTSGSTNGNSQSGSLSGTPGYNLKGRTLSNWSKPTGTKIGTIVVNIWVNRQGKVIKAIYARGTGAIASDNAARKSCEKAALNSSFSVNLDGPAEQSGTITYKFE